MVTTRILELAAGRYDLRTTLFGHGWVDLAPHEWSETERVLRTALAIDDERAVDVIVRPHEQGVAVEIESVRRLGRATLAQLRRSLRRMLRLDVDLGEFWRECSRHERLAWVPTRAAGHLMQSATLFEDLLRLLFTTNCSWSATKLMCRRTIDALGPGAPSGRCAFPSAARCALEDESFWRETVRAGYRARSVVALARAFQSGRLRAEEFEDPGLEASELERRLLALPGFGPYAVGHALRGLGHFEKLALDSWVRARMRDLLVRTKPPADSWFEREYRRFGRFAGLALWMDLTADWHGESGR
jgi:N-glycosylase/DNA lyase